MSKFLLKQEQLTLSVLALQQQRQAALRKQKLEEEKRQAARLKLKEEKRQAALLQLKEVANTAIDATVGKGAAEALEQLDEHLNKVYTDLFREGHTYPLTMNLAMILKQVKQENRHTTPVLSGAAYNCREKLHKAARYARFALAAYEDSISDIMNKVPELTPKLIHHISKNNAVKRPSFFVATDPVTDALVVAIRGASSMADTMTDALCQEVDFYDGKAHGGISESALTLVREVKPVLQELLNNSPKKNVVVTGHSLGAATAVLATLALFRKNSCDWIHKPGLAECFAFAPPPVFCCREKLPEQPCIYSIVNNMDCIPRTCLHTMGKLLLAIREVDKLPISRQDRLKFLMASVCPLEPKLPDYKEIPNELTGEFRSHEHAGTLIVLHPKSDGKVACEKSESHLADRLLLHPTMFEDHKLGNYIDIIDSFLAESAPTDEGRKEGRLTAHGQVRFQTEDVQELICDASVKLVRFANDKSPWYMKLLCPGFCGSMVK